jgi:hypothetical protein
MELGIGIAVGVLVLVGTILAIVFTIVRAAQAKRIAVFLAELAPEGIVRDSGMRSATIRYRNYRRPGYAASANIHNAGRQLIMTSKSFAILSFRNERCALTDVGRYEVAAEGNVLRLTTDNPVDATGHMDIRVRLDDATEWARALRDAGAKSL